jgi:hypothetical protein
MIAIAANPFLGCNGAIHRKREGVSNGGSLMSTGTMPAGQVIAEPATSSASHVFDDLYQMSVDEYERLAEAGMLKDRRLS